MTTITNELIYEILKKLWWDVGEMKVMLVEQDRELVRMREEIKKLRGDCSRHEGFLAELDLGLQRLEVRIPPGNG